jgi:signal transduction histidine kinase
LGNAQLVASTLTTRVRELREASQRGMTRKGLDDFLNDLEAGTQLAQSNLVRAAALVQDFKDAAIHRGTRKLASFALGAQMQKIELLLQPVLKRQNHLFTYEVPQDLTMHTDGGALEQVITNLVNNSLLHAFDNRPQGHMHLAGEVRANEVAFVYTDDGVGMDAASLAKVFDPFFTTKFGQGGSGLGMFVVYNLVSTALGGSIEVQSAPGQGFCCRFVIPIAIAV